MCVLVCVPQTQSRIDRFLFHFPLFLYLIWCEHSLPDKNQKFEKKEHKYAWFEQFDLD